MIPPTTRSAASVTGAIERRCRIGHVRRHIGEDRRVVDRRHRDRDGIGVALETAGAAVAAVIGGDRERVGPVEVL